MKSYTAVYDSILTFHLLPVDEINRARTVLVQIFSTHHSWVTAEKIASEAKLFFPHATIVGLSTYENATSEKAREPRTILAITTFEKSRVHTARVKEAPKRNGFETGVSLAQKALKRDTRLLLLYCDPFGLCVDELLEGIRSVDATIPVAGLLASDGTDFSQGYLLYGEESFEGGALLLSLGGDLAVETKTYRHLKPVGPAFRVDEAQGCEVRRMDGMPARSLLCRYLGEEHAERLPLSSFEIALSSLEEGPNRSVSVLQTTENGFFRTTGRMEKGSLWRFAYPDHAPFEFCPPKLAKGRRPEAFWLFGDLLATLHENGAIHTQVETLAKRATVVGAYGYGLLTGTGTTTQTVGVVALSERAEEGEGLEEECPTVEVPRTETSPLAASLAHLGETMLEELALEREAARQIMDASEYGILVYDASLRLRTANAKAYEILGLDLKLQNDGNLATLEEWVVQTLQKGLHEKLYIRVGKVLDPATGAAVTLQIATTPLVVEGRIAGGMATVKYDTA
ncbi:FIST N-terminal domain-containing protein [Hydrogenimonas sp.]